MSDKDTLDDFWNISALVPKRKISVTPSSSVEPVEITAEPRQEKTRETENDTVITRFIPPYKDSTCLTNDEFESVEAYTPQGALIHKVTVKKRKTKFNYYGEFLKNAVEYMDTRGFECEFTPFFSYVPMYDQMNEKQLSYYFWFRENVRSDRYIKTDRGYLLLYIFELLNLAQRLNVKESQAILMSLWNQYQEEYPAIGGRLADWICDFSLLHRLPPPTSASSKIIQKVHSLKEYFICLPEDDVKKCVMTLMRYCSSYDYRTSKFCTPQNKPLFDEYIIGALCVAVKYYSSDGNILSGLDYNDSTVSRDAYAGAVCVADQKYRIEVSYCSFSRSNELRFLIGDIIKYSENKLRTYIGVKSKMTVYSVSVELRRLIDDYFENVLPKKRQAKPAVERREYDTLYDVPIKPLSLENAAKIEELSWRTTNELVSAFEEDTESQEALNTVAEIQPNDVPEQSGEPFEVYKNVILDMINGDENAIIVFAKAQGKMPDTVAEAINEIAYDVFGDLLVEDDGMGNYSVVEDYKNYFISDGD